MATVGMWILGLLAFILVLVISVGLHEGGHMAVAKLFKLSVPKFFVGFGKTLWSFKTKKTEYGVKMIPLGGFVNIQDDKVEKTAEHKNLEQRQEELSTKLSELSKAENERLASLSLSRGELRKARKEFQKNETSVELEKVNKELKDVNETFVHRRDMLAYVAPWKRILVYLAGPAVNLVLGTAIIMGVLLYYPSTVVSTHIKTVNQCSQIKENESCAAEKAGIKNGDTILAVEGTKVRSIDDITPLIEGKKTVDVTVQRDGKEQTFATGVKGGYLGVNLSYEQRRLTVGESIRTIENVMYENALSIVNIPDKVPGVVESTFTDKPRDPEAPSSIVNVGKTYGDTSASKIIPETDKVKMLITYSGLLNLGLGFINLVPIIAMLDGGKISIAVIDQLKIWLSKITRRKYSPVGVRGIMAYTMATGSILISFMGLLIFSDIVGIFKGQL